jgi:hypothetical protein
MQSTISPFLFSLRVISAPWLWCILGSILADAQPQNFTIDDSDHAIWYSPRNAWASSPCGDAKLSPIHPGHFIVHGMIQHPMDRLISITLRYNSGVGPNDMSMLSDAYVVAHVGTAIYAFCIIANTIANTSTTTRLFFTIDGQPSPRPFEHKPDNSNQFIYNVPVYANTTLEDGDHQLIISLYGAPDTNGLDEYEAHSLILFDYAVYT